jgi:aryl-phospho-beta-D-glucosidase BglC (GH1 family)
VHGDYQVQQSYAQTLTEAGYNHIEIPDAGEVFEIG